MTLWSLKFSLTVAEYVNTERLSNYEQSYIESVSLQPTLEARSRHCEHSTSPHTSLPVTKAVLPNPGQLLSWFLVETLKNGFLSLSHLPVILSLAVVSQQICMQLILF